ncbi:putative arginyltransferase [Helianthus annuus]|nr:putative arginyltransferase [Helianthus annuus]
MRYKATYRPSELLCPLHYKWVPFDIAKRLLDRKSYVVLSDFAILQKELSLLPNASEYQIEEEEEDYESNDVHVDEDEEMFEDSDDAESVGPETASLVPAKMRKDTSSIVIGLRGKHLKYKVLFFFPFYIWSWKNGPVGYGFGSKHVRCCCRSKLDRSG